jgi:hypothetical protein
MQNAEKPGRAAQSHDRAKAESRKQKAEMHPKPGVMRDA